MGLLDLFRRRRSSSDAAAGLDLAELARRLDLEPDELQSAPIAYRRFELPKRAGGRRVIHAPEDALKGIQRRILRRLLGRLSAHPMAFGFEPGRSIVDHASHHVGQGLLLIMDLKDFFPATRAERLQKMFKAIGWGTGATDLLTSLCTFQGGLPQGAPTSPRLSNLVNRRLDTALSALAASFGATYSRYADDLVFSWADEDLARPRGLRWFAVRILAAYGYRLNPKKTRIMRSHQRQQVCGLVVNQRVALPRKTRRWLRAVEHHLFLEGQATLSPDQLRGWLAYRQMIEQQR